MLPETKSDKQFGDKAVALLLAASIFIIAYAAYMRILPNFSIGPFRLLHWLGWIGALYIATFIPAFHYLKQKHPKKYMALFRLHMFGNLLSVSLISSHVVSQLTRTSLPDLATGLTLIMILFLLVSTGIILRFFVSTGNLGRRKGIKFLHMGVTMAFLLDLFVHVLHGLGYI